MKDESYANLELNLKIASKYYYWKPEHAFFRSIELNEYLNSNTVLQHPILDLGCKDGIFTNMLRENGVLNFVDIFTDISLGYLKKIRKDKSKNIILSDARHIPLKNNTVSTIIANGLFPSIPTSYESDIDLVISDAYNILVEAGLFLFTVTTPQLINNLFPLRLLKNLPWIKDVYLKYINKRLTHYLEFDEKTWTEKLKNTGFNIVQIHYYFTPGQGFWYGIFLLPVFRLLVILKMFNSRLISDLLSKAMCKLFLPILIREMSSRKIEKKSSVGWILFIAQK